MKGSTYKRCKCRGDDGRELGADCPKLRRKDGSWNPRHGSWYYSLELDAGANGKRRRLRRGGFASETDAEKAMAEALQKEARGGNAQSKILVGQYLDDWLKAQKGLRRNTHRLYGGHIAAYLKPHLGHIELDRLRVRHLDEMFDAIDAANEGIVQAGEDRRRLRAEARDAWRAGDKKAHREALAAIDQLPPHRRPVGAATKQRIKATLRTALSDALREGLIGTNVAKLVKLEAGKRPKALVWTPDRVAAWQVRYEREVDAARTAADGRPVNVMGIWQSQPRPSKVMVWTPEQTGVFLDRAARHRLYALFYLAAFAGLRRGEVCGIEWADVDLDAGMVAIRIQRVAVTYRDVEDSAPKTDSSDDTIPLDESTVKVLRTWRAAQNEERLAWGEAWVESGKVFTRENGEPLHPEMVFDLFQRLAFEAGLPPIRLHDLRHGAATLMLAAGADMKLVQALLRHSSITITSDTYTNVLPDVARQASAAAVALVPRAAAGGDSRTDGLPSVSPSGGPNPSVSSTPRKTQVVRLDGGAGEGT
ncbi:tyrosine-type recombinase/integrase [Actinomadura sp. NPDC048032]|uniref:tyrosine-type recombinase/integrase n=1 Tax=Actinomadura sp. NPDC048032 TaxID=3155747 RepID=UPI0033CB8375